VGTLERALVGTFYCLGHVGDRLVGCGRLGVARQHVFCPGERVGAGGMVGSVSLVEKMKTNSERTLYTRPVNPPAPPRHHSQGFQPLVPSWSPTVAACRVVRVVDGRKYQKWKSTVVDASGRSRDLPWQVKQNAKTLLVTPAAVPT